MRESKKGVFTFKEITELVVKKYPGRWASFESAYASVKATAQALGIGDINGKRKFKQIAAVDVSNILAYLERTNTRKASSKKGQQNFFALLPRETTETEKRQIAEALTKQPAALITSGNTPDPEALKALETAAGILGDALRGFLDCLVNYERGRA